ncbi:unnamed protein product [Polarella glacialis]|uniref:Uncharacterized protein n=1 Tax=Polarella glacialis TaxID=89957 RepID=A0A813JLW6_POLGL|nr:unnamed protein product [Polarella glacialis]CAE8679633.1 unnamed protein product [Polarella glacialis]
MGTRTAPRLPASACKARDATTACARTNAAPNSATDGAAEPELSSAKGHIANRSAASAFIRAAGPLMRGSIVEPSRADCLASGQHIGQVISRRQRRYIAAERSEICGVPLKTKNLMREPHCQPCATSRVFLIWRLLN